MRLRYSFTSALRALSTNRSRTILTILGIVIGITAIILIASIGTGAKDLIINQVQGLGSNTIVVIPGREPTGPTDSAQIFSDSLKEKDIVALEKKSNAPNIGRIMPVVFGGETGSFQNETYRFTIFGGTPIMEDIFDIQVEEGVFFSEEDIKSLAPVAVIGTKVKEELFGADDPIGKRIRIKNTTFRVIGLFPEKGQVSFFNFDDAVVVPVTTARQYIFGIKYYHRFIIEAHEGASLPAAVRDIELTLRESHGITDPSKDDFFVQTQADLAERLGTIGTVLTLFLSSVAGISLFVAGIGIMNIMLVSVTERTREIGLRKAIGATERDILTQFLLEAITLTATGGIIGIILGVSFSFGASLILSRVIGFGWSFSFPWLAALIGIIVSALIGLVFGLYPARQAARKSPMEALRYE